MDATLLPMKNHKDDDFKWLWKIVLSDLSKVYDFNSMVEHNST